MQVVYLPLQCQKDSNTYGSMGEAAETSSLLTRFSGFQRFEFFTGQTDNFGRHWRMRRSEDPENAIRLREIPLSIWSR